MFDKSRNPSATPVRDYVIGGARAPVLILLAAGTLLFLMACANAAALIVARFSERATEMSVRAALGAAAPRLARQVIVECFVLALAASIIGAAAAAGGFWLLVAHLPLNSGAMATISLGGSVIATTFALTLLVTLAVSAVPASAALRAGAAVSRQHGPAGLAGDTHRVHRLMVVTQIGMAVFLVVGAGLLVRTVARLRDVDLGFQPRDLTVLNIVAPASIDGQPRKQLYHDIVGRIAALPGVAAIGMTNRLPLRDLGYETAVSLEGRPELDGAKRPSSLYRTATPGFLRAMGMRLAAGRGFAPTDDAGAPPVALISESFARRMWPGQNALGKHITESWDGGPVTREVVGVVSETRTTSVSSSPPPALWVPEAQVSPRVGTTVLAVRSTEPAARVIAAVRGAVAAVNPEFAVTRAEPMSDVVASSLAESIRLRFFLSAFAVLALAIGVIGVFGVVSYAVVQRRAEFALRMALGATPRSLSRHVLRVAMEPVVWGVGLGCGGAFATAGLLRGFVYGITPVDPPSFAIAAGSLCLAALLAALQPALRASRTDPAEALRAGS